MPREDRVDENHSKRAGRGGGATPVLGRLMAPPRSRVGLWIDHREAVIVSVTDFGEIVSRIRSNVEKQLRPLGGSRAKAPGHGPQEAPPDDRREKEFMGHLNAYFDIVLSHLRGAESILIFGPGEAKGELRKRAAGSLRGDIIGVETADKMTERQVAAKVRQRFPALGRS